MKKTACCRTVGVALMICLCRVSALPARASDDIADEPVALQLLSGRTYVGAIDARTDRDRLWLRFGSTKAEILRPIEWHRVAGVRIAGEDVPAAKLRALVVRLRHEISAQPIAATGHACGTQ